MRTEDVENLRLRDLKHVLTPLKRGRMLKDYIDVGFDTEYTSEDNSVDRELLSLQFSLGRGKSAIYFIEKREGVSCEELLRYALDFLKKQNTTTPKHIFLVAHFAIAELSKVRDFYDDYVAHDRKTNRDYTVTPKIREFNKAIQWERRFENFTLHLIDLYGHMKTKLEKIGLALGYEKLKLNVDGLDDNYWKTHMKELLTKHREIYIEYAMRDAEVVIEAWRSLVEMYKPLNLDPHLYSTYTSITIATFRKLMTKLPCKTVEQRILIKQKMKNGQWREHVAKTLRFAGDLNARELAILSYWGGNNQAFARGYFPHVKASYYDFKSLYIIAGILQPLSNADTEYRKLTLEDISRGCEGFCEVDFEFPRDTIYPTLPVQENYYHKLMFPLRGTSCCTCAEIRQALTLGVEISQFRGYGFNATENEINNDLRPFLADMLKKKSEIEDSGRRNSTEYMNEKGKMVGVIGRFGFMQSGRCAEDISRFIHKSGMKSEEFRKYGKKTAIRAMYTRSEVGGSWHIEWASLILGKARSMAGWAINQGERCLLLSTDGGLWLGDPRFENSDVNRELAKFHSGIRREDAETPIDEIWIARNRCYAAWSHGALVHAAQGGIVVEGDSDAKEANFAKIIRSCLNAHESTYSEGKQKRLTGLMSFIHDGTPLNSVEYKIKKAKFNYDYKRKLCSDVNVFSENTFTTPYDTAEEAWRFAHDVEVKAGKFGMAGKAGRPRGTVKLTPAEIEEIKAARNVTHAELAEKYGVSISNIRRLLKN